MSKKVKDSSKMNLEPVICERFTARQNKDSKTNANPLKFKHTENNCRYSSNQLIKNKKVQENLPLRNRKSCENLIDYSDGFESYQPSLTSSKERSRSVVEHESWGQLLKSNKCNDRSSIFGSFDPLRTLHFLVKELQFQLKTIVPENNSVLQIVLDMHQALKRVPPEVASTVHLQQALDTQSKKLVVEPPEKLKSVAEKGMQTVLLTNENEKIHQIMIENTLKLDASCKQMENICMNLKTENENLLQQLKFEKENTHCYKMQLDDLMNEKTNLTLNISTLNSEKEELKLELQRLKMCSETEHLTSSNNYKSQISDLNHCKALLDQECKKLKHQLKLSALEKEKFSTILTIRDKQINVMKKELIQLNEIISDKFLGFHKNAVKSLPKLEVLLKEADDQNKENFENSDISTILSDQVDRYSPNQNGDFKELCSGSISIHIDSFSSSEHKDRKTINR